MDDFKTLTGEIEVEKKPREEMNGIVVYDSYAKLTGNTKIV